MHRLVASAPRQVLNPAEILCPRQSDGVCAGGKTSATAALCACRLTAHFQKNKEHQADGSPLALRGLALTFDIRRISKH